MRNIRDNSLCLIISTEYACDRDAMEVAGAAIAGGVDMIQMREKAMRREDCVRLGLRLAELCRKNKVTFIVNDDPVLAKEVGADGVHLGKDDLKKFSVEKARAILGADKIVGISTSSIDEIINSNDEEVDYIGFGPVFPTKVKEGSIGTNDIGRAVETAKHPVFFIGGIDISNMDQLLQKGARNVAVMRAILQADDMVSKTKKMKKKLIEDRGGKIT